MSAVRSAKRVHPGWIGGRRLPPISALTGTAAWRNSLERYVTERPDTLPIPILVLPTYDSTVSIDRSLSGSIAVTNPYSQFAAGDYLVFGLFDAPSEAHQQPSLVEALDQKTERDGAMLQFTLRLSRVVAAMRDLRDETSDDWLTTEIHELVCEGGGSAIQAVRALYRAEDSSPPIVAEILKIIGEFDDSGTEAARRALLTEALSSKNATIRLGALTGAVNLRDASLVEVFQRMRATEPNRLIKRLLERATA